MEKIRITPFKPPPPNNNNPRNFTALLVIIILIIALIIYLVLYYKKLTVEKTRKEKMLKRYPTEVRKRIAYINLELEMVSKLICDICEQRKRWEFITKKGEVYCNTCPFTAKTIRKFNTRKKIIEKIKELKKEIKKPC